MYINYTILTVIFLLKWKNRNKHFIKNNPVDKDDGILMKSDVIMIVYIENEKHEEVFKYNQVFI